MDTNELRTCTECGTGKPLSEFHRNGRVGLYPRCRSCRSAKRKAWRETYRVEQARHRRAAALATFGLTVDEYETMLASQGGVCAICSKECTTGRRLAVDHDHASGRVRALLCYPCNVALGHYEAIKEAAEAFLARFGAGNPLISHGTALAEKRATPRIRLSSGASQLTDDDVRLIRKRYAAGDVTQRALAREYRVSQNAVGLILRGKTWRHVEDADGQAMVAPSSRHVDKLVQRVRRLTDGQIAEARRLHAAGSSYRSIAAELGVHHTTVMRLLTGKHWKAA